MKKPRMFIGSSVEGKDIAEHIQLGLDYDVEPTCWHQGIFGLSDSSLESLLRAAKEYDFAALVLTPDDLVMNIKRGTEKDCPRDNVVFELGLFMGAFGRKRTFIVYNRDKQIDLPTDLAGVTSATFADRSDGNLQAALGPVCTRIKQAIKACGLKKTEPEKIKFDSISDAPEGLEVTNKLGCDQIEIKLSVFEESPEGTLVLLFIYIMIILFFPLFVDRAGFVIAASTVFLFWWCAKSSLVRIKRKGLHILTSTLWVDTRGSHIHANDIKNVRVVDSQVVVETDTRKYTIGGSGFNPEQLRWIKNCILKVVDVQRRGNKE